MLMWSVAVFTSLAVVFLVYFNSAVITYTASVFNCTDLHAPIYGACKWRVSDLVCFVLK